MDAFSASISCRIGSVRSTTIQSNSPDGIEVSTLPDSKLVFSIKPAIDWDTNEKGRHNDLYVFCHYKATSKAQNILDMGLWDFYVYPTFKIDSDLKLKEKNSISLYRIKKLGVMQVSFDVLNDEIVRQISIVSEHLSRSEETA